MKKKIKKIPRFNTGTPAVDDSLQNNNKNPDATTTSSSFDMNHVNAIAGGLNLIGGLADSVQNGTTVTAGGVLKGIGVGAASGAAIGSVVPGIGTAIGAVGGALIGGISAGMGSGGSVNEQTGAYTDPSGIAGLFGHSKRYIRQKSGRVLNGIQARQMGLQMNADWYMNDGYNYLSMADGGIVPSIDIFADNGEIVETPGNMPVQLPDTNLPEDSFYMTVPPKTKITSNKLLLDKLEKLKLGLNPNKKYAYADAYRELEKPLSKGADIYAENTNKLNAYANKLTNDIIVDMLETKKLKKGIKPKTKNLAIAAAIGLDDENRRALYQYADSVSKARNEELYDLPFRTNTESVTAPEGLQPGQIFYHNGDTPYVVNADGTTSKYSFLTPFINAYNRNIQAQYALRRGEMQQSTNTGNLTSGTIGNYGISPLYFKKADPIAGSLMTLNTGNRSDYGNSTIRYGAGNRIGSTGDHTWYRIAMPSKQTRSEKSTIDAGNKDKPKTSTDTKVNPTKKVAAEVTTTVNTPREVNYGPGGKIPRKVNLKVKASDALDSKYPKIELKPVNTFVPVKSKSNIDWADTLYNISSILTPLSDKPKSEKVSAYVPHAIMGPTEYNIDPLLTEAALTNSINRYNLANINPNTGANMAFGLQSGILRNRAIANAYAAKNNAENQMAMQNASIYNNLSRDFANARHIASIEQAQNDAAARNIARTGRANALQNWGQILRDSKSNRMNAAKLQSIMPLLKDTMPTADYNELIKLIA